MHTLSVTRCPINNSRSQQTRIPASEAFWQHGPAVQHGFPKARLAAGHSPQSRHQGWPGSLARPLQFRPAPPGVAAGQQRRPGRARPRGSRGERRRNTNREHSWDRGAAAHAWLPSALQVCGRGCSPLPAGPGRSHGTPGAWHLALRFSSLSAQLCSPPAQPALPRRAAGRPGRELPHGLPGHASPASTSAGSDQFWCDFCQSIVSHFPLRLQVRFQMTRAIKHLTIKSYLTWNSPSDPASGSQVLYSPRIYSHLESHRDWGKGFQRTLELRYSYTQMKHPSCLLNETPALLTIRILLSFTI